MIHKIRKTHTRHRFHGKDLLHTFFKATEAQRLAGFDVEHPNTTRSLFRFLQSLDQLQTWNGTSFTDTYSVVNTTLANPGATNTSWSYNGNLPTGAYTMRASVLDVANKRTSSSWVPFHVGNDMAAPGVAITTPANSGTTSSGSISLSGTATDDIAVRYVDLVIYNAQLQTWNGSEFTSGYTRVRTSLSNAGGTNTNWSYNFAPPAGSYTFRATAIDGASKSTNGSWRTFSIT